MKKTILVSVITLSLALLSGCGSNYPDEMRIDYNENIDTKTTTAFFFDADEELKSAAQKVSDSTKMLNYFYGNVGGKTIELVQRLKKYDHIKGVNALIEKAKSAEIAYVEQYRKWDAEFIPQKIDNIKKKFEATKASVKEAEEYVSKYDAEMKPFIEALNVANQGIESGLKQAREAEQKTVEMINAKIIDERIPVRKINDVFSDSFRTYKIKAPEKCAEKMKDWRLGYIVSGMVDERTCMTVTLKLGKSLREKVELESIESSAVEYLKALSAYSKHSNDKRSAEKALSKQNIIAGNVYPEINEMRRTVTSSVNYLKQNESEIENAQKELGKPTRRYLSDARAVYDYQHAVSQWWQQGHYRAHYIDRFNDKYLRGKTVYDVESGIVPSVTGATDLVLVKVTNDKKDISKSLWESKMKPLKRFDLFVVDLKRDDLKLKSDGSLQIESNGQKVHSHTVWTEKYEKASAQSKLEFLEDLVLEFLAK